MIDYRPAINLIFGLTCIGTLFGILAMMGVFNSSPPKNNYELWLVYLLIFGLIATTLIVFAKSKESEDENLKFVPLKSKKFYEGLKKYTVLFIVYVIFVIGLYILNPFGIMTKYGGTTIFTTIWIGIVLIVLIGFYYYFFNNPNEKPEETFFSDSFIWYLTPIYIMFSFYISGLLIYGLLSSIGLFNQDVKSTNSVLSFIINIFFICLMLSIIYKLINLGGFLENSPIFKLIVNIIFYIPCLLVIIFNNIFNFIFKGTTLTAERRDYAYLLVAVILFTIYFFLNYIVPIIMKKYYKRGGKQLINNPVETEVLTNITTYQELSDSDKYDYRYSLSFWLYIDSFPPSTNSSYTKITKILSYGDNPCVSYYAPTNTLLITVKQGIDIPISMVDLENIVKDKSKETNEEKIKYTLNKIKSSPSMIELDNSGQRIIYKDTNYLLQKWNNIILNYNGGTLDVFYNGELVKSAIEVVPYIDNDSLTVGTENGINGYIANLIYFKKPLDIITIHKIYESFKNRNPPSISNDERLVPIN